MYRYRLGDTSSDSVVDGGMARCSRATFPISIPEVSTGSVTTLVEDKTCVQDIEEVETTFEHLAVDTSFPCG